MKQRKKYSPTKKEPMMCIHCGSMFDGTKRAKYCTPKCRLYAWREKK